MKQRSFLLFGEAAEELGIDRNTLAGLVKALGIEAKPTGLPGRAKGLDEQDMKSLRKALGRTGRAKATA